MLATSDVLRAVQQHSRVSTIHVFGDESAALLGMLAQSGLDCIALSELSDIDTLDPQNAVLAVVASEVRPESSLAVANEACVTRGLTWLPIGAIDRDSDGGDRVTVGPLVVPGSGACFDCSIDDAGDTLEYRSSGYRELEGRHGTTDPNPLNAPRLALASLILSRWIEARDPRLPGRRFTLTRGEPDLGHTWIPRSAACRTCSSGS